MKRASTLPLTALGAITLISVLIHWQVIPPGVDILDSARAYAGDAFYLLIFLIILLESIVYVGFYFPGQFFAVVLVVTASPDASDVVKLTLVMVAAATLGSWINYHLGSRFAVHRTEPKPVKIGQLLLAMIHMNSLAFFMFNQGANGNSKKVIWLAGLLNLPYYLLLIAATAVLDEQIMQVAENTWLVVTIVLVWLAIALYLDFRSAAKRRRQPPGASTSEKNDAQNNANCAQPEYARRAQ